MFDWMNLSAKWIKYIGKSIINDQKQHSSCLLSVVEKLLFAPATEQHTQAFVLYNCSIFLL